MIYNTLSICLYELQVLYKVDFSSFCQNHPIIELHILPGHLRSVSEQFCSGLGQLDQVCSGLGQLDQVCSGLGQLDQVCSGLGLQTLSLHL